MLLGATTLFGGAIGGKSMAMAWLVRDSNFPRGKGNTLLTRRFFSQKEQLIARAWPFKLFGDGVCAIEFVECRRRTGVLNSKNGLKSFLCGRGRRNPSKDCVCSRWRYVAKVVAKECDTTSRNEDTIQDRVWMQGMIGIRSNEALVKRSASS